MAQQPPFNASFRQTITDALQALGKKHLTMILHGASFPALPEEDTGVGTPNSQGAKGLMQFIHQLGFNSLQLGPGGEPNPFDFSPYGSTSFSNNTLFIDLAPLAQSAEWGGILSNATWQQIVAENPNKNTPRCAYPYAAAKHKAALQEAFDNFVAQKAKLGALWASFETFKTNNQSWLEPDALYEALSHHYQNDYWGNWSDKVDQNLFNPQSDAEAKQCEVRKAALKSEYASVIAFYQFCQFVAARQIETMKQTAKAEGIQLFADRQVAYSNRDTWANQSVFMSTHYLGVPPDYFSKDGQAWGFPQIDPTKLYNTDGSLGPAGEMLTRLYHKIFLENPDGVRIDHIIGLIDPWVYPKGKGPKVSLGGGRLFSSPQNPDLAPYAIIGTEQVNLEAKPDEEAWITHLTDAQITRYGQVLQIILDAAKAQGLAQESLICEDLGTLTLPAKLVLEKLGLGGMRVSEFSDPRDEGGQRHCGQNVLPHYWLMIGSHDNEPIATYLEAIPQDLRAAQAGYLADDLLPHADWEPREAYKQYLLNNPKALVTAKFAELFASPSEHLQIFFCDFWGIRDRYNLPGTSGELNWSLRLPNDYAAQYRQALQAGDGCNLPEALVIALHARGLNETSEQKALIERLDTLAHQLKGLALAS